MSFHLCSSWNVVAQIKNWFWNSISRTFFNFENKDEVKRLAMCLVVDGDKYHKQEKLNIFGFKLIFMILCF